MVKNPQRGHGRTDCRVAVIARAISSGWSPRDWTIHKAMRSAERGPIPGICRNCTIKSRIADGYSVFLKTGGPYSSSGVLVNCKASGSSRRRYNCRGRSSSPFGTARILKLRVGLGPSLFPIKHNAIPERVAPCDLVPRSRRGPEPPAHKSHAVRAHPLRSRNRWAVPRESCWPAQRCAARAERENHKSDSQCKIAAPTPPARRWRAGRADHYFLPAP